VGEDVFPDRQKLRQYCDVRVELDIARRTGLTARRTLCFVLCALLEQW
jgi:hypothetical protein